MYNFAINIINWIGQTFISLKQINIKWNDSISINLLTIFITISIISIINRFLYKIFEVDKQNGKE